MVKSNFAKNSSRNSNAFVLINKFSWLLFKLYIKKKSYKSVCMYNVLTFLQDVTFADVDAAQ